MMLRGLWKLTWIEIKVFMREPLGAIGTIVVPVLVFVVLGRLTSLRIGATLACHRQLLRAPACRFWCRF